MSVSTKEQAKEPQYLFLNITNECNLRCRHCMLWKTIDGEDALTLEEKRRVINEFRSLSTNGTVVFTGGEPLRKKAELVNLAQLAADLDLPSIFNTNATLLHPEDYEELLTHGPTNLLISLDTHVPEIQDWSRNHKNYWQHAVETLKGLVATKKRLAAPRARIQVSSIVYKRNYRHLPEFVDFLRQLGVEGVAFQALSRTFCNDQPRDEFFESELPDDLEALDGVVAVLKEMREKDDFILAQSHELDWMKLYFRNPDFLAEQVCDSGNRNIMVGARGEVRLCFFMEALNNGGPLDNVRAHSLPEIWNSPEADRMRALMARCRRNCSMLNCHKKIDGAAAGGA